MRLWTLHPQYLDAKGLVALWREGLLAQAVLNNATRGYQNHPQLHRFRATTAPLTAVAVYLQAVADEAKQRNYNFAIDKIGPTADIIPILVTQGQLEYEWHHLRGKLQTRAPSWYANIQHIQHPQPHPLFCIVPGEVAAWEVQKLRG